MPEEKKDPVAPARGGDGEVRDPASPRLGAAPVPPPGAPLAGAPSHGNSAEPAFPLSEREALAESLVALMYLDAELAAAQQRVAGAALDPAVASALERIARDHLRHVDALGAAVDALGVEVEGDEVIPAEDSALLLLVETMTARGLLPALRALLAAERFAHAAYEAVLELPGGEEIRAGLERALEDEREHMVRLGELSASRAAADLAAAARR